MKNINYYLHKNPQTGEILYLEYDKIKGYSVTPKTRIEDGIDVHKIVFVNEGFSEKIIRKKIEIKLRYLIQMLEKFDQNGGDEGSIRATLMEAERLKVIIINQYVKYLGNTYGSLSVKKIQVIINQLRIKLYNCVQRNKLEMEMRNLYYLDEEEEMSERKGRGR